MGYSSIHISYNRDTLCEEIRFTEPGEKVYELGSIITLSDARLWRNRRLIVHAVNYIEDASGGLSTEVVGFSEEYKYTRKSPTWDVSFFSMTSEQQEEYTKANPCPSSKVFMTLGDEYGAHGWTMHTIVQKIVMEWMDLPVVNNLPDFDISDFTISLGTTFFEAITGLISVFEPFVILTGGTLYILGRGGAGALSGGQVTLAGTVSRSVNREYVPIPSCIRVDGVEGEYMEDKDVDCSTFEGTVTGVTYLSGGTNVHDVMKYLEGPYGNLALQSGNTNWTMSDGSIVTVDITMEYDMNGRPKCRTEIQESQDLGIVSRSVTEYSYFMNGDLQTQVSTKETLFIYNSEANSYANYDGRDHDPGALASYETFALIESETIYTKYTLILSAVYSVDTITARKVWNLEEERWITTTTVSHDLVAAGGQQHIGSPSDAPNTMQVYAGTCLPEPLIFVGEEPPAVFTVPTPSWESIEICYTYLAELVVFASQSAQVVTPIIDPIPLMAIGGLGSIIESGLQGDHYITGYSINIDANTGDTTELALEAKRG